MGDVIIIVVLVIALGLAIWYIWSNKKKGVGCIGCPMSAQCHSKCCPESEESGKK